MTADSDNSLSTTDAHFIADLVKQSTGIVLDETKKYLIESRLEAVRQELDYGSLLGLVHDLRVTNNAKLNERVSVALATHETYFFRDKNYYKMIEDTVIPRLVENKQDTKILNIWSCACSAGQEAYSLLMCIHELGLFDQGWKVNLLGTDISEAVINYATEATYNKVEINRGLPEEYREKYFEPVENNRWTAKRILTDHVTFKQLNLLNKSYDVEKMDLILVRNVLIYFDSHTKQHVINLVQKKLRRNGVLILGGTENLMCLSTILFPYKADGASLYYVKE